MKREIIGLHAQLKDNEVLHIHLSEGYSFDIKKYDSMKYDTEDIVIDYFNGNRLLINPDRVMFAKKRKEEQNDGYGRINYHL